MPVAAVHGLEAETVAFTIHSHHSTHADSKATDDLVKIKTEGEIILT